MGRHYPVDPIAPSMSVRVLMPFGSIRLATGDDELPARSSSHVDASPRIAETDPDLRYGLPLKEWLVDSYVGVFSRTTGIVRPMKPIWIY